MTLLHVPLSLGFLKMLHHRCFCSVLHRLMFARVSVTTGEPGVCVRDEGSVVSRPDDHERRRPEVSHPQHGEPRIRRGTSRVLFCRDHIRTETSTSRKHCLQVGRCVFRGLRFSGI